jgi:hypothetical protein
LTAMRSSGRLSSDIAMNWLRLCTLQVSAQRAVQMLLSRFSLLLAAFLCFAPGLRSHQGVPSPTCLASIEAAANTIQPATSAATFSLATTIEPYSPWRFRLKSVLQDDSDSRIARESDVGPVPMPDHFFALVAHRSESGRSRPLVALRC